MTPQEAPWAKEQRKIDAETGGPFVIPPWLKKKEEEKEEEEQKEKEKHGRPGITMTEPSTTCSLTTKDSTMAKTFTTTGAALFIATTRALATYPNEEQRILKGAAIANQPFDVLDHGTHVSVKSSNGKQTYTVNGTALFPLCQCPDHAHGAVEGRCKHVFAKWLHRKAASIHKAMLASEQCHTATVGNESGIVHIVDDAWFHVPYGGPRGYFTTSADCVLGSQGSDWPAIQKEKERWEAAYYAEYGEIA